MKADVQGLEKLASARRDVPRRPRKMTARRLRSGAPRFSKVKWDPLVLEGGLLVTQIPVAEFFESS